MFLVFIANEAFLLHICTLHGADGVLRVELQQALGVLGSLGLPVGTALGKDGLHLFGGLFLTVHAHDGKLTVRHGWMKADTMEDCHVIDACLNATVCKNLFLCNRQETNFYLLMLPGHKKFKTKDISKQLGVARLSFAKDAYMEEYLDITPGSVSVLGLINDTENHVQLLMDKDLVQDEYVGCHPCINTSSLRLKMDDLLHVLLPAMHHEPIFVTVEDEESRIS